MLITIDQTDNNKHQYWMSGTDLWLNFQADTNYLYLTVTHPDSTPYNSNLKAILYKGNCQNLVLIDSADILKPIETNNLTKGDSYYIHLKKLSSTPEWVALYHFSGSLELDCETIMSTNLATTVSSSPNSTLGEACLSENVTFSLSEPLFDRIVSHGYTYSFTFVSPGLTHSSQSFSPPYTNGQASYQTSFTQAGTYYMMVNMFTAFSSDYCGPFIITIHPKPSVSITQSPSSICTGQDLTISATSNADPDGIYQWTGPYGFSSSSASFMINNTALVNSGSYIVTVTDDNGCTNTASLNVHIYQPDFFPFLIIGPTDNCENHPVTYTASLQNPNLYYNWSISTGAGTILTNHTGAGISQISVNLNSSISNPPAFIVCQITDSACFHTVDTLQVYSCCTHLQPVITDLLINDSINSSTIFGSTDIVEIHTLYILSDVTFNGSSVFMAPCARIYILPGGSLTITNGSHLRKIPECDYMWDGIYLEDPDASLIINGNSILEDAMNAVVSSKNAGVILETAIFDNNFIGLKVHDNNNNIPFINFLSPYNIQLKNCTFTCSNPNQQLVAPPYNNYHPFAGIHIERVDGIEIGDITSMPSLFSNTLYGIYILNSNANVFRCNFTDIIPEPTPIGTMPPANAGIVALRFDPDTRYGFTKLNLGIVGNQSTSNEFLNCYNGLFSYNQKTNAAENSFGDCRYAIKYLDPISPSSIFHNNIYATDGVLDGCGITVNTVFPYPRNIDLSLSGNYIANISTGIDLTNQGGRTDVFPKIYLNHIFWNQTEPFQKYLTGIKLYECNYSHIFKNFIENAGYSRTSADIMSLRGIKISQTQGALLESNLMRNLGSGILTYGSLIDSRFYCNTLDSCWHGFYFQQNTALSDQGYFGNRCLVPNNRFLGPYDINNAQEKLSQASLAPNSSIINGPVNWVQQSGDNEFELDANINNFSHPCFPEIESQNVGDCYVPCVTVPELSSFLEEIDTTIRNDRFGSIIRNEIQYELYTTQFKWYERNYLFERMVSDTLLIDLGGYEDYLYEALFDSLRNGSCGQVNKLFELLERSQIAEAEALTDEISENEIWLSNINKTAEIYLQSYALGILTLDSSQIAGLWPIALSIPFIGGPGVYAARVMLGIDPEEYNVPYFGKPRVENTSMHAFKIYPNPAASEAIIQADQAFGEGAVLKLFNIAGSLIRTFPLNGSLSSYTIRLTDVPSGIYCVILEQNNFSSKQQKLVIVK